MHNGVTRPNTTTQTEDKSNAELIKLIQNLLECVKKLVGERADDSVLIFQLLKDNFNLINNMFESVKLDIEDLQELQRQTFTLCQENHNKKTKRLFQENERRKEKRRRDREEARQETEKNMSSFQTNINKRLKMTDVSKSL